jgi:hypothetical protein
MPAWPSSLTIPGPLIVVLILGAVILALAATIVGALRRGGQNGGNWGAALNGARERQRAQVAQMDALHQAVADLAADKPNPEKPHE